MMEGQAGKKVRKAGNPGQKSKIYRRVSETWDICDWGCKGGKIMDEKKENQLWDCFEPVFEGYDPDSSPFVWEYIYSKIYFEKDWEFWKEKMGFEKVESSEDLKKKVLSTKVLKKRENRKIACVGKENPDFGGDTDFNFNEQKYNYFKNIMGNDSELLEKLEKCRKRHHALENFSLMPRTGGLQLVKGRMFDRLDCFIWSLDNYFKNREDDHIVLQGVSSVNNRKILKVYLDSFCDGEIGSDQAIYKYCSAIYKMDNKWWVDRMKVNGEKEMKGEPDRVKEYMELAIEYWDTKLENYSNIYNVAYGEGTRRRRSAEKL